MILYYVSIIIYVLMCMIDIVLCDYFLFNTHYSALHLTICNVYVVVRSSIVIVRQLL